MHHTPLARKLVKSFASQPSVHFVTLSRLVQTAIRLSFSRTTLYLYRYSVTIHRGIGKRHPRPSGHVRVPLRSRVPQFVSLTEGGGGRGGSGEKGEKGNGGGSKHV